MRPIIGDEMVPPDTSVAPAEPGTLRESRSWRRTPAERDVRARWIASRLFLTAVVVGFAVYFATLLRGPFEHARPMLILLGEPIAGEPAPENVTIDLAFRGFRRNDFDAFSVLAGVTGNSPEDQPQRIPAPSTNDGLGSLRRRLAVIDGAESVAIVYVSGWGVSLEGRPRILWNRIVDGRPTSTELQQLLQVVRDSPASTKLILLDAGDARSLPNEGMFVNEFPDLLAEAVAETGDTSLWVLMSHSTLEVSHVSAAERRSVFGKFVVDGLAGQADANGDRTVDLAELYEFAARTVGRWVDERTLGRGSQTPVLLWGGGDLEDAHPPDLVPVDGTGSANEAAGDSKSKDDATPKGEASDAPKPSTGEPTAEGSDPKSAPQPKSGDGNDADSPNAGNGSDAANPAVSQQTTSGADSSPAAPATPDPNSAAPASAVSSAPESQPPNAGAPPATAPTTGGDAASSSQPPAAGESETGSDPGSPAARIAKLEKALNPVERQLHETWQLRDRLLERRDPRWRTAADVAPAEWRELERTLLVEQERIRRGQDSPAFAKAALAQLAKRMQALDTRARAYEPLGDVTTLGLLEFWSAADDPRRKALAEFDKALSSATSANLKKWLAKADPAVRSLEEVALANELLATSADWSIVRPTLVARRRFERVMASSGPFGPWIDAEVGRVDDRLRDVERVLRDRVDPASARPLLQESLAESERRLASIERTLNVLGRAVQARNDAALRLADDVDWAFQTSPILGDRGNREDPTRLMETLSRLADALGSPADGDADNVANATADLIDARNDVEQPRRAAYVSALLQSGSAGVAREFLESLLANPATRAEVRLLAADVLEGQDRPREARQGRHLAWTARLPPVLLATRWQPYVDLAGYESHIDQLQCHLAGADCETSVAADQRRLERLRTEAATNVVDASAREAIRREFRLLGREVSNRRVTTSTRLPFWAAFRALGPDARFQPPIAPWRTDLASVLRLRRDRLQESFVGASPLEVTALTKRLAAVERDLSIAAGNATPYPGPVRGPRLRGSIAVGSREGEETPVELEIDWRGRDRTVAWLIVEAPSGTLLVDPSVSNVETPESLGVAASDRAALREAVRKRPPALELRSGTSSRVRLPMELSIPRSDPAHVVVHVVAPDEAIRFPATLVPPPSPLVDVRCEAVARTFATSPEPFVFYPFPNRTTNYRLLLGTTNGVAREVDAELYAPDTSSAAKRKTLSAGKARDLLDDLGVGPALATAAGVKLAADGSSVELAWKAGAAAPSTGGKDPGANGAGGTAGTPCGRELLLVVRDKSSGNVDVIPLRIEPQHPRRYLVPTVSYDADTRRIRATIAAVDEETLPSGEVTLQGRFSPPLEEGQGVIAEAKLSRGGSPAVLSPRIDSGQRDGVVFTIDADGWPRAFSYRIDPGRTAGIVPEWRDPLRVVVTAPKKGIAFAGTTTAIPIAVRADLPALQSADGLRRVVVGLDVNRDRELTGEPTVEISADRSVVPTVGIAPDGRLAIHVTVRDLVVKVEVPPGTNQRLDVLARVDFGERTEWSMPVPIVIDGEPPRLRSIGLAPRAPIVIGDPLECVVTATDDGLSGVARVEVAFDEAGTGEFPAKGPVFTGTRSDTGDWRVTIPTEKLTPGDVVLLVRATDAVGNMSTVREFDATAVSKQAMEARLANTTRPVRGRVTYLDDPVGEAEVFLQPTKVTPTDAGHPLTVKTAADGSFLFPAVKPGAYQVTAEKVVKDRKRKATATIDVPPTPQTVPFVDLALPYKRLP